MRKGFQSWLAAILIAAGIFWAGAVWDARALAQQKANTTDTDIAENVHHSIAQETGLARAAQNVQVVVKDGEVTLQGQVETPKQKDKIAERARAAAGADHVIDQMELAPIKPHGAYKSGRWL